MTNNEQTVAVKSVDSTITATGKISAQDQAILHFQTGGKLISLPFKEGDKVVQGQTIAQLDTYILQRQLTQALNTYRSTRDNFDQTKENQNKTITQNTQRGTLNAVGAGIAQYGTDTTTTNYLDNVAKHIVDENQSNLDNSVITVEITNYALQLATLSSPLTGIITHEDITVPYVNITPETSFTVADPTTKVFQANIPASDIDYMSEGMPASIVLDGTKNKIAGTIVKIYPSKVTLSSGEEIYKVDIQSDALKNNGKLDQSGTAFIMTNAQNVTLIPSWTVLSGKYVWIDNNGTPELRAITIGKTHGDTLEVTSGLSKQERVITDPKSISTKQYLIL